MAVSFFGVAAVGAPTSDKMYSCKGKEQAQMTIQIMPESASVMGKTAGGQDVDFLSFETTAQKTTQTYIAGPTYMPVKSVVVDRAMVSGAKSGNITVSYKNSKKTDKLSCKRVHAEGA